MAARIASTACKARIGDLFAAIVAAVAAAAVAVVVAGAVVVAAAPAVGHQSGHRVSGASPKAPQPLFLVSGHQNNNKDDDTVESKAERKEESL